MGASEILKNFKKLNFIESEKEKIIINEIHEIERMLRALIKSLESKHLNP